MTTKINESREQLKKQLEAQGWEIVSADGKTWCVFDGDGHSARINVTAHKDGRQADYEIISTNDDAFHPDWKPEQDAEITITAETLDKMRKFRDKREEDSRNASDSEMRYYDAGIALGISYALEFIYGRMGVKDDLAETR